MLGDFKTNSKKIKTAMWILVVFLQKVYEMKMERKFENFDCIWQKVKIDFIISKKCKNGHFLDEDIFDI